MFLPRGGSVGEGTKRGSLHDMSTYVDSRRKQGSGKAAFTDEVPTTMTRDAQNTVKKTGTSEGKHVSKNNKGIFSTETVQ